MRVCAMVGGRHMVSCASHTLAAVPPRFFCEFSVRGSEVARIASTLQRVFYPGELSLILPGILSRHCFAGRIANSQPSSHGEYGRHSFGVTGVVCQDGRRPLRSFSLFSCCRRSVRPCLSGMCPYLSIAEFGEALCDTPLSGWKNAHRGRGV